MYQEYDVSLINLFDTPVCQLHAQLPSILESRMILRRTSNDTRTVLLLPWSQPKVKTFVFFLQIPQFLCCIAEN